MTLRTAIGVSLILTLATTTQSALAQTPTATPSPKTAVTPPPTFELKIASDRSITFKGASIPADEIAKSLARELKVPVRMSAIVAKQKLTLKFDKSPLETFLLSVAPQVYVDYETHWDRSADDWVGIELTGFNEREPPTPIRKRAFLLFAGSTEDEEVTAETIEKEMAKKSADEAKAAEKDNRPMRDVTVKDGLVTVHARKQQAAALLLDIASKAHLGFRTRGDLDNTLIDLEVSALPIDQIPAAVGRPGVGLLMRRNLTTGGTRAVAMLLGDNTPDVKPVR